MSTSSSSTSLLNGVTELDPWKSNYVNEEHIQAFANALSLSDTYIPEGDISPASPKSPAAGLGSGDRLSTFRYGPDNGTLSGGGGSGMEGQGRVEKIKATSDFAPIHQRVSKRRTGVVQQGLTYHLMRWPLLGFFFMIIWLEFSAYVLTRQVVNVFEYLVAWRGHKAKLRQEMRKAKNYDDWMNAARRMDAYLGFDEWKETDEDPYFDYLLVKRVRRTLTRLRAAKDTRGLMDALATCVRSNFAGTEGVKMYSETFYGTKRLVEEHIKEVAISLDFVRAAKDVSLEEKRAFFRAINKNYGSSALCLSGGASFGYYHFGVIKAFLESDLLPRVVTGTSAGALAAALLCTRTDVELKSLLEPRLADKITACSEPFRVWFRRFRQTGARFDSVEWARKAMFFTRGSLTFKEAYELSGRALNVSVVPSDRHSPTILLNHLTAPNCLIWSAILASAAVPGILNPVVLMAKDRYGNVKPHNLGGSRFKDGSLREDIPLGSLHTQFNCNFSIVSQTNPHIHLFFFAPRGSVGRPVAHRKGKGWRGGFILSALESYIKLDLTKHFKVIRDLDLLPQLLQSDWSGVFLQRFSGDLTLTPRSTIGDWTRILSDPNRQQLARMIQVGQRVSWPALHMVNNRMVIERAILRGRTEARAALHHQRPNTDNAISGIHTYDGLPESPHIPIESDADAGFLLRSRKSKAARPLVSSSSAIPAPSSHISPTTTRRRPNRRQTGERASATASTSTSPGVPSSDRPTQDRPYSISDTIKHVRASSLNALASPFRGKPPPPPDSGTSNLSIPAPRRKSQLSISRWFGGVSEDSEDDEEELAPFNNRASDAEGSATPIFSRPEGLEGRFGGSAIADEPSSMDEGTNALGLDDGNTPPLSNVVPSTGPSGESREKNEAGGLAAEDMLRVDSGKDSSPPQQDRT